MMGEGPVRECRASWLGTVEYAEAWRLQQALARARAASAIPDTLLLLEHPPVYTTGRRDALRNLRVPAAALGAPLVQTDRGGDITFHGPGQLVVYPIITLQEAGLGVSAYVRTLEEAAIRTLAAYGLTASREEGLTGVWVGPAKIAAIGVRVSRPGGAAARWVTEHGLAVNVCVDLSWFGRIVPCGIEGRPVTSMAELLRDPPRVEEVGWRLAAELASLLHRCLMRVPASALRYDDLFAAHQMP